MSDMILWSPGVKLEDVERQVIKKAYAHFKNKTTTANALGIAIRTLDKRLEKIEQDEHAEAEKDAERRKQREADLIRARGMSQAG